MAIAEVSVVPLGTGDTTLSSYVAEAVKVLRSHPELSYELTGMGTIIQGEMTALLAAVGEMHESVFTAGARRVVTTLKIDDRRDKPASPEAKIAAVKKHLES
jgi:uncharacterized protein (TIGR00106 family)